MSSMICDKKKCTPSEMSEISQDFLFIKKTFISDLRFVNYKILYHNIVENSAEN